MPVIDCFVPADAAGDATPVSAVPGADLKAFAGTLPPREAAWLETTRFAAGEGDVCVVPDGEGGVARVLLGFGETSLAHPSLAVGKLPGAIPPGTYRLDDTFPDRTLASTAWGLGAYRFTRYSDAAGDARRLALGPEIDDVMLVVGGVSLARDLVNTAANDLGPAELAAAASQLAARHDAVHHTLVGEALRVEGFPLVHAVGAAATPGRAPRLVEFSWGRRDAPAVTLVGKGVCFDTGGLDIKPPSAMLIMKKDMGGAAAVLGLASMIMTAELPVRLRVLIPAVENAIAGAAFRPGDVFRARNGKTVEIGNTDAEGRLILADALAYATERPPHLLIDMATLTGAARAALGPEIAPFYTDDDDLAARLATHATAQADPMWRMPLWRPYMAMLDSRVADMNNVGGGGFAGSITAALFLSRFVSSPTSWIHADIYGWNPTARPGRPEGGEGTAIRALFAMIRDSYARG